MMNRIKVISAKTHTPEYLLHKYWARKPHNIIASFLDTLVPEGGTILDPFCGSGVVLHEAQKQSKNAIGFDVNPIAVLISKVLIDPPSMSAFENEFMHILNEIEKNVIPYYSIKGKRIRYCLHDIVSNCSSCGTACSATKSRKSGKKVLCQNCGNQVRLNLESLNHSIITSITLEGQKEPVKDTSLLEEQTALSNVNVMQVDTSNYIYSFVENRRILAFKNMKTDDLFTTRNFSILCTIANAIDVIENEQIKNAALLLLTASVAQCSRLIPNRNNLSTGGPAWSVPGFWVPAQHLETNPIVHLTARYKKFVKGLSRLHTQQSDSSCTVKKTSCHEGISSMVAKQKLVDLVFFDPPYGDNVPYIEFSAMWNSFLKDFPNPDNDISVSDRDSKVDSWEKYRRDLLTAVQDMCLVMKETGHLVITFNNNDIRAWEVLLSALQSNHLLCDFVTYQIPAVVSSKAQFAIDGSYISDIYSVYSKSSECITTHSLDKVVDALLVCSQYRGGVISEGLAQRVMMITWIKENIDVSLLKEKENILKSLFIQNGTRYILKNYQTVQESQFKRVTRELARKILIGGPCDWAEMYEQIALKTADFGIPDAHEVKEALSSTVLFNGKRCLSSINMDRQLCLTNEQ
ncbi:MAG: DNA methyltransferase [Anaerolineaceae bacterium]